MTGFKHRDRIEIPVHYDAWMRGARFGTIVDYRPAKRGLSAYYLVQMDRLPKSARPVKLWKLDWEYAKLIG